MLPLLVLGAAALLLLSRSESAPSSPSGRPSIPPTGKLPLPGASGPKQVGPFTEAHIKTLDGAQVFTPEGLAVLKGLLASKTSRRYDFDSMGFGTIGLSDGGSQPPRNALELLRQYVGDIADKPVVVAAVFPAWFGEKASPDLQLFVLGLQSAQQLLGPKLDNPDVLNARQMVVVGTSDELAKARFFQ